MVGKDLIMATLLGSGGGSSGSGGGVKITHGTIVPISPIDSISHGLGVKPDVFVWYVSDTTADTSSTSFNTLDKPEKTVRGRTTVASAACNRMVGIYTPERLASITFGSASDWGYYTYSDPSTEVFAKWIGVGEQVVVFNRPGGVDNQSLIPFHEDGRFTITWFAISGVTL